MIRSFNIIFFSVTLASFALMTLLPLGYSPGDSADLCHAKPGELSLTVNESETFAFSPPEVQVLEEEGLFYLSTWFSPGGPDRLTFVFRNVSVDEGSYELNQPAVQYVSIIYDNACVFSSDDYYTGTLNIVRFDRANKTIAGCFSFLAYGDDCRQVIKVSDGRFNLRFREEESESPEKEVASSFGCDKNAFQTDRSISGDYHLVAGKK